MLQLLNLQNSTLNALFSQKWTIYNLFDHEWNFKNIYKYYKILNTMQHLTFLKRRLKLKKAVFWCKLMS